MLRCESCNEVFDNEDVKVCREDMGEHFGTPAYEEISCCPHCGANDLAEVEKCSICGEYFESYELDNGICEDCQSDIKMRLRKIIEANFTGEELNVIRELEEVV